MDFLPEKYLKNKVTNSFIVNTNENYLMPQKFESYKKQNSSKINADNNNNNNSNFSNFISVNERQERKNLLLEIDNIIEELEFFQKEKRKMELIEIMGKIFLHKCYQRNILDYQYSLFSFGFLIQ